MAAEMPADALARLKAGKPVDLIIEYESAEVETAATALSNDKTRRYNKSDIADFRKSRYKTIKDSVETTASRSDVKALADFSHLPMTFKRFNSVAGLNAFLAQSKIKAVYPNKTLHRVLAQSLPLISQPVVTSVGETGSGTTVAVIDDGIDYTRATFGPCTAPGTPATCKVTASIDFGSGTTDNSHGTNVSGIVLGVAPGSKIAMLNAFSGDVAYYSDIIAAINWAIANQASYNIVAINMSLGDGSQNTTTCSTGNPFRSPITNARNVGISVVIASGNEAYTNAISGPACTPGAISVGAVYDSNIGGVSWGSNLCTDSSTAADKVTCFSNSASFLTLLAPGALINAAGISEGGTSQATPHVAGAIAVLRSVYPSESLAQTLSRLTSTGVPVSDSRNGIIKPRLNLLEAARPVNDVFANRITLSGNSGTYIGPTLLSTREASEPNHAGIAGAHSVWWKWTAPASGQLSLDTHGSNFDTLLAVYKGSSLNSLIPVIANDNDGVSNNNSGLLLQVQSGQEYVIAVDGAISAQGSATLNWALNSGAAANLSVNLQGPGAISLGTVTGYTLTLSNAGPQSATNVQVTMTLPAGASYVSGPDECTANGNTIVCLADTLANSASKSFAVQILWSALTAGDTLASTVTSDLPDATTTDNSAGIQLALYDANQDNNDAPTLPEWGMLIMAAGLLLMAMRAKQKN